jgi:cell wall-associated NlpC family hydrolase
MKNRQFIVPIGGALAVGLWFIPARAQTGDAAGAGLPATSGPIVATSTPAAKTATGATARAQTMSYTVAAGDTLTKLADKFNTTRKKLKALNDLATTKLKPGQVILVPVTGAKSATASATKGKAKHHTYLAAQPVQDFDIPASTFASCPVPVPDEDATEGADATGSAGGKPAPVAQLVSPAEMSADEARQQAADERLSANVAPPRLTLPPGPKLTAAVVAPAKPKTPARPAPSGLVDDSRRGSGPLARLWGSLTAPHLNSDVGMNTPAYSPANDWGFKFLRQARALGDRGIEYDDDWRPPGERVAWTMDCSNTTRWLYKATAGINLPRTASDQYYYLRLQGKAWDVPTGPTGWADVGYLQRNLKPGDLLFWENTYRPERQPPITHVMVFLGTNERGQWIMAGSQSSRGGEHNRSNGGPDVYVFRPSQPCGGYSSWFVHHQGRFCAFGRPLEADPSKFAVDD